MSEVDRARQFLMAGLPLVGQLPFRLQLDVELFARGGLRILERIEQIGYRVWDTRPVVTRGDVARLFLRSCCGAWGRRLGFRRPPRVPDIPRDARSESVQS